MKCSWIDCAGADTIIEGSDSCSMATNTTGISLKIDPPSNACSQINLIPSGGKAPYTASIIAGYVGRAPAAPRSGRDSQLTLQLLAPLEGMQMPPG